MISADIFKAAHPTHVLTTTPQVTRALYSRGSLSLKMLKYLKLWLYTIPRRIPCSARPNAAPFWDGQHAKYKRWEVSDTLMHGTRTGLTTMLCALEPAIEKMSASIGLAVGVVEFMMRGDDDDDGGSQRGNWRRPRLMQDIVSVGARIQRHRKPHSETPR